MQRNCWAICIIAMLFVLTAQGQLSPVLSEQPTQTMRLVFFTDVHARSEWDTPIALQRATRAINAAGPDLIIGGGDFITDGYKLAPAQLEERWQVVRGMTDNLAAPLIPVVGNHDLEIQADGLEPAPDPRRSFRDNFHVYRTARSLELAGRQFILLDAAVYEAASNRHYGVMTPEQLDWLRQELAMVPTNRPVVLATHYPLASEFLEKQRAAGNVETPDRLMRNAPEVLALFTNHHLALVLQGHLHVAEAFQRGHTWFITGGAICGQWWRGPWHGTEEGFYTVDLLPDGQVRAEYLDYGWDARRPPNQ